MAGPQSIWGIDIGRCALKAIKLRSAGDGKVELIAHDYIEHAKILSQPDANRDELITNALEKFLSRNDLSKDRVVVGVPGQHTLARFTKLPPVAPKKIPDIVRYEADQQIPFDMDEVIWDYQKFEREGLPDIEVGIFAMKRELIRGQLVHFEQAALEPVIVQSGPLAVYNAAHFDGILADDTTVLVDIGAENADLIIATPDSFWTRTIAIGGNSFTEALVKSFKLSFSKAENLKRTAATSKYARQVFQAMRPVFADLVQELQRSIGFYSSTHRDANIQKLIGVGNAFKLPGLQKYVQQNLSIKVKLPDSFVKVTDSPSANAPQVKENLLSMMVPYGLAVQGLDLAKVNTNLLPAEIAKQIVWRKKRPTLGAAAACLFLAGGLIWMRYTQDMAALPPAGGSAPTLDLTQAVQVIDRGSTAQSKRDQAQEILAAGMKLKSEHAVLREEGLVERDMRDELIQLQDYKWVIPAILQGIHESVPAFEDTGISREERKQVVIEAIHMSWERDVNEFLESWSPNITEETDFIDNDLSDSAAAIPGMMVFLTCTTPHKDGSGFVSESLMANLRKNLRREGDGFFVNRVFVVEGNKVIKKADLDRARSAAQSASSSAAGRALDDRYTLPGRTVRAPSSRKGKQDYNQNLAAILDPLTNESMENDWRYELAFDIWFEDWADYKPDETDTGGDPGGGD